MIDTHIHLDEEAYASDREELIGRQREAGVTAMLVPGVNAHSIEGILAVCRNHPQFCFPALGFHPQDVAGDWEQQWDTIERAIRTYRNELIAVGEIGLDYHYELTYRKEQHKVFRHQLALAAELDLPVMIHMRDATEDTLRILKEAVTAHSSLVRGVVHCFNGSAETAKQILDLGFYLGIGGVITFKNCKLADTLRSLCCSSHETEQKILQRILLETDGPYLAPTPHRGERNESRLMVHVVDKLAEVFNSSPDYIIAQTTQNAKQLFRI